ncbi:MAG TPA: efflux RND transporter periplasmic adaptor subunit, partial [Bacteroidetes bacterium]|nr:efflux RND transporter periplasmic adaptor subunit [Bacteroidota bacterium]
MRNIHLSILFILLMGTILSCNSSSPNNEEKSESVNNGFIEITKEQFLKEKMELGMPIEHKFINTYMTNGVIKASPNSKADVYSYLPGIVKTIKVNQGNYVKKGQLLCTIISKDFIDLQSNYLETLVQLKATEIEYNRSKILFDEKIVSQKEFFETESRYKILNSNLSALKTELKIIGVDIENLEQNNIISTIRIVAPISGFVNKLECNIGEYVNPETILMKILNGNNSQIHFFVYQEFVHNLKEGQSLEIYLPENPAKKYSAKISSIGKSLNPGNKSIECIAIPQTNINDIFIDEMYLQVEIIIDSIESKALPKSAILDTENKKYVLVKENEDDTNLYFKKVFI